MLKTQDGKKFKTSCSTGNIVLAVDDTATCDRLKNVFGNREHQSGIISPVNKYHYEGAN